MSQIINPSAPYLPLLAVAEATSRAVYALVTRIETLYETYKAERRTVALRQATAHLDRRLLRDIGLGDEAD